MAELADAHDSGSCLSRGAGSSPVIRTSASVLIGFEIIYKDTRFLYYTVIKNVFAEEYTIGRYNK